MIQSIICLVGIFFFPLLIAASIYRPIHRLKNKIFPTYLHDKREGKVYQLVKYEGYDQHSAVVAVVRELGKPYDINAGDWYYNLVKSNKKVLFKETSRANLRLVK